MMVFEGLERKFLVVAFIVIMVLILHASANAKMVNLATNFGLYVCLFIRKLFGYSSWLNATFRGLLCKVAINKGNSFIRISLFVVIGTLLRFAYDVFEIKSR
jgi:hypothetical protein